MAVAVAVTDSYGDGKGKEGEGEWRASRTDTAIAVRRILNLKLATHILEKWISRMGSLVGWLEEVA